jgi:hypothetical protein
MVKSRDSGINVESPPSHHGSFDQSRLPVSESYVFDIVDSYTYRNDDGDQEGLPKSAIDDAGHQFPYFLGGRICESLEQLHDSPDPEQLDCKTAGSTSPSSLYDSPSGARSPVSGRYRHRQEFPKCTYSPVSSNPYTDLVMYRITTGHSQTRRTFIIDVAADQVRPEKEGISMYDDESRIEQLHLINRQQQGQEQRLLGEMRRHIGDDFGSDLQHWFQEYVGQDECR